MSLVTDLNGRQVEAFDLIMKKENAWDILDGKKALELRSVSPFYVRRFLNPKRTLNMTFKAFEPKDIHAIHFHDYNNSWFLDCSCSHVVYINAHPNCNRFLHALRNHDLDELISENEQKGLKEEDCDVVFGLVIKHIYGTNLTTPDQIKATGGGYGIIPWVDEVI